MFTVDLLKTQQTTLAKTERANTELLERVEVLLSRGGRGMTNLLVSRPNWIASRAPDEGRRAN